MQKAIDYVKANKKIITAVVLLITLVVLLYFINKGAQSPTAAQISTQDKSEKELKLAGILKNIRGVGAADVMINESDGKITGVVVVCEGAENIMTKSDILNAVSTALNIDRKVIAIYSMNV